MISLRQQLLEIAENACKDSGNLTTAQMKEVLQLVLLGVRQTARLAPKAADSLWKSDTWRSLAEKLETSSRFRSSPVLKKLCDRIAQTAEASGLGTSEKRSMKASKRKAEEPGTNFPNSKNKKHKSGS
jgi:DNA polymerase phi